MSLIDALRRDGDGERADETPVALRLGPISLTWGTLLAWLPIAVSMAFTAIWLLPELTVATPSLNDDGFHFLLVQNASHALSDGKNLIDHWSPDLELGFPQFHYYQHVPHVTVALLQKLSLDQIGLFTMFNLVRYLLLVGFPLTVYFSMRTLGFSRAAASTAAALSPLFSGAHNYGFEYESYIWRGFGMYTQLWAMHLSFLTVALLHRSLDGRKTLLPAIVSWSLLIMCHLVYAYMTAITSIIVLLLGMTRANARERILRFGLILLPAALITAYFTIPFTLSNVYLSASPYLQQWKYDSFGAERILGWILSGDLWDHDRLPVMTIAAALGLLVAVSRRTKTDQLAFGVFTIWLLLYFGRPTWGDLTTLMPMHHGLLFHRFIGYVDIGTLMLIGVAGDWVLGRVRELTPRLFEGKSPSEFKRQMAPRVIVAGLLLLAMAPAINERMKFYNDNKTWMHLSVDAINNDADARAIIEQLKTLPPGRTFAGLRQGFGAQMKFGFVAFTDLLTFNRIEAVSPPYQSLSLNSDLIWDFDFQNPIHYDLFNARYVVAPANQQMPPFLQPLTRTPRYVLYQAPTSGYFDLVGTNWSFHGDQPEYHVASREWLRGGGLPAVKQHPEMLVHGEKSAFPELESQPMKDAPKTLAAVRLEAPGERGKILAEGAADGVYDAQVQVDVASTLMLKVTYHPNWRATVDGKHVSTTMIMPSYVGIRLEPGKHDVHVEYTPETSKRLLLLVGGLTLGVVILAEWKRKLIVATLGPTWHRLEGTADRSAVSIAASGRNAFAGLRTMRLPSAPSRVLSMALRWELPQLAVVTAIGLIAALPTLKFKLMNGHDAGFHLPRIVEFSEALKGGEIFPRWAADFNLGYGEPLFNYYAPLFYYFGSAFRFLGVSYVTAENLVILCTLAGAGLAMYLLARRFTGWPAAIVAATAYVFAPYFLFDIYDRHAVSEALAFVFMPLALLGAYLYVRDGRFRALLLGSLAFAALILSSNSVALMFAPVLGAFGVWQGYQLHQRAGVYRFVAVIAAGLGLCAFFWMPALFEQKYVTIERMHAGGFLYNRNFHDLKDILFVKESFYGPYSGSLVGTIQLFGFFAGVVLAVRGWRTQRDRVLLLGFFLIVSFFYVFMNDDASDFIWRQLPLLQDIQFPWRMLSVAAFGLALVLALTVDTLTAGRQRLALGAAALLVVLLAGSGLDNAKPKPGFNVQNSDLYVRRLNEPDLGRYLNASDADFTPEKIAQFVRDTGSSEYDPKTVINKPKAPAAQRLEVLQGAATIESSSVSGSKQHYTVNATSLSVMRANTFYFPHWRAYIDGRETPVSHDNPEGLITFSIPAGRHEVSLRLGDTALRTWSKWLSFATLAVLIVTPFATRRRLESLKARFG